MRQENWSGRELKTHTYYQFIIIPYYTNSPFRETFTIVDPKDPYVSQLDRRIYYNDNIAINAENSKTFVMANLNNNYELIANVPHVGSWERFVLMAAEDDTLRRNVVCYGNSINLRAYNGKYVMYNMDGEHLLSAVADRPSKWEKFFLICPDSFK